MEKKPVKKRAMRRTKAVRAMEESKGELGLKVLVLERVVDEPFMGW